MLSNRQLFFENIAQTSDAPLAIEIERASGCWLYSPEGKKYFDLIAGVSVSNTGHNNPSVVMAAKEQMDRHMHLMVYGEFIQKPQVKLAEKLIGYLPDNLSSVFYTNSGSEAIEGALKLARRYTGRPEIICFRNAYHGSTMGALSVIGSESMKRAFRPLIPSVRQLEFNSQDSVDQISRDTACVLVEPIQSEAGIILPEENFLNSLRNRCSEMGAMLIFDEVQTGFGRTGNLFAMDYFEVVPDIVVIAKGFGGGFPLGAFVSSKEIMSSLVNNPALGHITTFGGHPVSCSAGLASLDFIVEHDLVTNALRAGNLFKKLLVHPSIKSVRGIGLLIAMELESSSIVRKVIQKSAEKGLVTDFFLFNDKCIRISPPLIITEEETEYACNILLESLGESSR
ncbi:MAG: aspartate aminotransferase family protein [Bacteroidales bacterium]